MPISSSSWRATWAAPREMGSVCALRLNPSTRIRSHRSIVSFMPSCTRMTWYVVRRQSTHQRQRDRALRQGGAWPAVRVGSATRGTARPSAVSAHGWRELMRCVCTRRLSWAESRNTDDYIDVLNFPGTDSRWSHTSHDRRSVCDSIFLCSQTASAR